MCLVCNICLPGRKKHLLHLLFLVSYLVISIYLESIGKVTCKALAKLHGPRKGTEIAAVTNNFLLDRSYGNKDHIKEMKIANSVS